MGQYNFNVLRSWIASFVDIFDIASGDIPREGTIRVGVVEFWGDGFLFPYTRRSELSIALGDYNDKADLINKINALQYRAGTVTYIESGLKTLLGANQFGVNIIPGRQRWKTPIGAIQTLCTCRASHHNKKCLRWALQGLGASFGPDLALSLQGWKGGQAHYILGLMIFIDHSDYLRWTFGS